jgi:hypothetical protein
MSDKELVPLPKYQINQVIRYKRANATIFDCYWGGTDWRYEVYIARGKNRGTHSITETFLIKGTKK